MKALLLAAGLGTRLRPLTDSIPKCLVPIHGKPLLGYWLDLMRTSQIQPEDILINLHYFPGQVRNFLDSDPFGARVVTVYEEELLGTGGTLLANRDFFKGEDVMMVHADNLSFFDMKAFKSNHDHRPAGTVITIMTFLTDTPETCGIVELDSRGVVTKFHEKVKNPPGRIANGAVYIIDNSLFDYLIKLNKKTIDFSVDVLSQHEGKINTFLNTIYHRDIGTPESYKIANADFPSIPSEFFRQTGK